MRAVSWDPLLLIDLAGKLVHAWARPDTVYGPDEIDPEKVVGHHLLTY